MRIEDAGLVEQFWAETVDILVEAEAEERSLQYDDEYLAKSKQAFLSVYREEVA